ncbi:MAG: calpastatin [Segetibacter sp.]|nr:calpastatin [Segetibacter sp.]
MSEEKNLQRFLDAQKTDYQAALSEIRNGRKRSHWMWYIFPQIQGLGFSETSKFYAIKDIKEAGEYLKHSVLGNRLIGICNELLKLESNDAHRIFGSPDDMKLKSSMTLFSSLQNQPVFQQVLDKFFEGAKDEKTLQIVQRQK